MAKSLINVGSAANAGDGDNLRAAGAKLNANANELYDAIGDGSELRTLVNGNLEIDVPPLSGKINKISLLASTSADLNAINPADYQGTLIFVNQTGTLNLAHGNVWNKVLLDTSGGSILNYTDPLKPIAYGGTLNDISDVDTESVTPFTGAVLKYDGAKWSPALDVTQGGTGLDADTLDGQDGSYYLNWNNFTNKPTVPSVLTDLGILDGTSGQVLTTNGSGGFTFTTIDAGSTQNVFTTINGDNGTTTANSTTDVLTLAGGTNIETQIVGDTVTFNYVGDPNSGEANQNAFSFVQGDSGIAEADTKTDTLTIAGGTDISTTVTGDTVTIAYTGGSPTFGSLSDTDITSPTAGAVVAWNGAQWIDVPQTIDQMALPAITALVVTAAGSTGYLFDQYGTQQDPTIYAISGTTIAFNLNDATMGSHPFTIETSGGLQYNSGLVHVDNNGTVTEGSDAQGKTSGTLYWKIPANISGNYAYQCSIHTAMRGTIAIKDISAI